MFNQIFFFIDYILMFVVANITSMLILLFFTMIATWFIKKFNNDFVNLKGKLPFGKIQWISAILQTIVSIILFGIISSLLTNLYYLSKKISGLEYWNQTQNVFRIQVENLNDRLFNFYKEIQVNNKGFLMESEDFH
ncbi:hypothetical protein [Bacillus cereus]|uniref:hypothetical protein n=1 Tax=Bacillus cereus TaxID=1396 RepID=UPI002D76A508|nr:hypothetical protein [Bacillus cereus]